MSDDILGRLRSEVLIANGYGWPDEAQLVREAADEIERLRAALERADILIRRAGLSQNGEHWEAVMQYETARAALENT